MQSHRIYTLCGRCQRYPQSSVRARGGGGKIFYLVSSTVACDTTPPCFTGNPPLLVKQPPPPRRRGREGIGAWPTPFCCWWCSPPGVTQKSVRAQPCRAVLGAAPIGGPAAQQGGCRHRPCRRRQPRAVVVFGASAVLRRLILAPSRLPLGPRCGLANASPDRGLAGRPRMPLPARGVGRSSFHGAALTVGTHTARSCHSVLLLLGRPPATTAQLRPIAAPRLIPRAPLASGSVAPDAAAPRGSTPLRSGRPRAILDPVITDWSCAPRGRSLGCPRLPHGGADGSRPEKLAPRGGGGGVASISPGQSPIAGDPSALRRPISAVAADFRLSAGIAGENRRNHRGKPASYMKLSAPACGCRD